MSIDTLAEGRRQDAAATEAELSFSYYSNQQLFASFGLDSVVETRAGRQYRRIQRHTWQCVIDDVQAFFSSLDLSSLELAVVAKTEPRWD